MKHFVYMNLNRFSARAPIPHIIYKYGNFLVLLKTLLKRELKTFVQDPVQDETYWCKIFVDLIIAQTLKDLFIF